VGFGYGRDLAFLLRQAHRVWGIDLSAEGRRRAELELRREALAPECLTTGAFEENTYQAGFFDAVLSHRMAHLLVTEEAVACFSERVQHVLRPGGILCIGARNLADLNLAEMRSVSDDVYEYIHRPGHCIRYWSDAAFQKAFGRAFDFLTLDHVYEPESVSHLVPCHLTVLIATKRDEGNPANKTVPGQAQRGACLTTPGEVCGVHP
jgi:SAM-dependent methyltransferase